MRGLGFTYSQISTHLPGVTERAVQYTCNTQIATPKKKSGRPAKLSSTEIDELETYVKSSKAARRMSYKDLTKTLYGDRPEIGVEAVKYALKKRGYSRRVALRKPPISEKNRVARLEWAHEHLHWSEEQWDSILWSDETWVKAGRYRKTWVTRRPGEELDLTCIVEK